MSSRVVGMVTVASGCKYISHWFWLC